ncbi:XF1762 family protein [Nonomuraea sp. NPDC059023]|uniref:XF1762 family protein n=1 Tax=unclassified Nonomuraea TaxID=2593643 RepID=UPI0036ACF322
MRNASHRRASGRLYEVPVTFKSACAFVQAWHRHHEPPRGHKFSIGAARHGVLVGVVMVGRPLARHFDNGQTLEVTRLASDGTPNVPSFLYARAWQAARPQGYTRLVTYIHTLHYGPTCGSPCEHPSCTAIRMGEAGASLRGAGWQVVAHRPARPGWNHPSRPREGRAGELIPRTLLELVVDE